MSGILQLQNWCHKILIFINTINSRRNVSTSDDVIPNGMLWKHGVISSLNAIVHYSILGKFKNIQSMNRAHNLSVTYG